MAEQMHGNSPDDNDFYKITEGFDGDKAFTDELAELDRQLAELDAQQTLEERYRRPLELYDAPHTEQSLDNVVEELNKVFKEECAEQGINPNATHATSEQYERVSEAVCVAMYNRQHELWFGNVVTATDALVYDPELVGSENTMKITGLFGGDKVIGIFRSPVVAPMPDETHAMTFSEDGDVGVGVGFLLEHPVVIDAEGNVHLDAFGGKPVIVSLNVDASKLTRYVFPSGL